MSHDVTKSVTFSLFRHIEEENMNTILPLENLGLNTCFCTLLFVCILGLNLSFLRMMPKRKTRRKIKHAEKLKVQRT